MRGVEEFEELTWIRMVYSNDGEGMASGGDENIFG